METEAQHSWRFRDRHELYTKHGCAFHVDCLSSSHVFGNISPHYIWKSRWQLFLGVALHGF